MSDFVVKLYLLLFIGGSILFLLLYGIIWMVHRRRKLSSVVRKLIWCNVFLLISGLIVWFVFSSRLLNNWLVMLCAFLLTVISVYASEALGKERV